jgi:hypothetical protein
MFLTEGEALMKADLDIILLIIICIWNCGKNIIGVTNRELHDLFLLKNM